MAKAPAEMMREFVRNQNFTSTDEVMTAMKDMFKDILQAMKRPWNVFAAVLCANNRALSWQNAAVSVRFHRNHSKRKGPPPDSENLGWLEIMEE